MDNNNATDTAELFDIIDTGDNRITHAGAMPAQ